MNSTSLDTIKDLEWPFRASLSKQAAGGTPLNLPWSARYIAPGTSFKSALVKAPEGPFLKPSPFDSKSLEEAAYVFEKNDLQGSFMEATSTSSGFNSEHLSVSLGITVGCSFLNASVSGRYDKSLLQNSDVRLERTTGICSSHDLRIAGIQDIAASQRPTRSFVVPEDSRAVSVCFTDTGNRRPCSLPGDLWRLLRGRH